MKTTLQILKNEEGSLIAIVLLLMAVLTVIGISASNTAITESQIVRNETCYKTSFFRAESAAAEVIQLLQDRTDLDLDPPPYLMPIGTIAALNEPVSDADWELNSQPSAIDPLTVRFIAVSTGIQTGSSMAMGEAQVHSYVVYGREQDRCGGDVTIGLGFTKPF